MKKGLIIGALACLLPASFTVWAESYLVIAKGNNTNRLEQQILNAGGAIQQRIPQAGVLVVESENPEFRAKVSDAMAVMPNLQLQMTPEPSQVMPMLSNPPFSGSSDPFFDLQWGHTAVGAVAAWNAGVRGQGVRVAVLDGGFNPFHPDLAPNVIGWADFTGEGIMYGPNPRDPSGNFSHGNHVAGTIAAAQNGVGIIGVAPDAELLLVKVLGNMGSGSFANVMAGIVYAADFGDVNIINMSLGAQIPQGSGIDSNEVAALRVAFNRVMAYAAQKDITIIVSAGNSGLNLDQENSLVVFPADMPHALSISATGPEGWGVDPYTNLDTQAIYTNYGMRAIDFAAPGGDDEFFDRDPAAAMGLCTVGIVTNRCFVFDYVLSAGANSYYWSIGTSMAAPHAAGIAALILSEQGGQMKPAQLRAEMRRRAERVGKSGKDPVFGHGRVHSGYF